MVAGNFGGALLETELPIPKVVEKEEREVREAKEKVIL